MEKLEAHDGCPSPEVTYPAIQQRNDHIDAGPDDLSNNMTVLVGIVAVCRGSRRHELPPRAFATLG
jgi:hypothetical protein